MAKPTGKKLIAENRRARRDYELIERVEAGVVLTGSEVKSARDGHVQLGQAYADVRGGEAWLIGASISEYAQGGPLGHQSDRDRKLLLHRGEIDSLYGKVREKGLTLVPTRMYLEARPSEGRDRARARARAVRQAARRRRARRPARHRDPPQLLPVDQLSWDHRDAAARPRADRRCSGAALEERLLADDRARPDLGDLLAFDLHYEHAIEDEVEVVAGSPLLDERLVRVEGAPLLDHRARHQLARDLRPERSRRP